MVFDLDLHQERPLIVVVLHRNGLVHWTCRCNLLDDSFNNELSMTSLTSPTLNAPFLSPTSRQDQTSALMPNVKQSPTMITGNHRGRTLTEDTHHTCDNLERMTQEHTVSKRNFGAVTNPHFLLFLLYYQSKLTRHTTAECARSWRSCKSPQAILQVPSIDVHETTTIHVMGSPVL
jgi:hypothetical protein